MNEHHLVFVYNSNSDLFSTVADFVHKIFAPATYQCRLCALTYGSFAEKQEWKNFIDQFPIKAIFLHKDEFIRKYHIQTVFPSVFIQTDSVWRELVTRQEIEKCQTIGKLKELITNKYDTYVQHHHTNL